MLLHRNFLMMENRGKYFGLILVIFGIISNPCDARAVNISNTWTLPHDGFTVFYRFFRDQISWFEADAVCQFHHANLVTVTNSVEFDASREFLRILDVTEPVWIGLMRSQNSDRFYWSNSKPLVSTTEYWAESLPVIDAPLCAVIDPVRDYRWHALRCGGPETASFLCEMNVPSWAEECVIRDIPSLTIQYMADSGTVEITKDCGDEEGTIIQVCRGKQDLDKIINNLICKNEKIQQEIQQIFSHERQNLVINSDLLDSHKKSIEIIKNAQTDNNEDNNISVQNNNGFHPMEKISEQETENPVQKLIEQFDVEELMQADQPQEQTQKQETQQTSTPSEEIIPSTGATINQKTLKRQNKKVRSGDKKLNKKLPNGQKKEQRGKNIAIEDMMMGDQPILGFGDDDLNEIQEPLPHTKKMLPQDLKHEDDNLAKDKDLNKAMKEKIPDKIMLTTTTMQSNIVAGTTHLVAHEKEMESITIDNTDDETVTGTTTLPVIATDDIVDDVSRSNGIISTTNPLAGEENLNTASGISSDGTISSLPNEASISITTSESESLPSSTLTAYTNLPDSTTTTATISSSHVTITTLSPGETKSTPAVTIGHPMHPQQPRSNIISEETAHQHIKETNDNHFIPPMLMVKSHYQSPKSALGHNNEHQLDLQIVRKKTTPTDSNTTSLTSSNDEVNHSGSESNSITTTTIKSMTPIVNDVNHHTTTLASSKVLVSDSKQNKPDEVNFDQSTATQVAGEKLPLTTLPESEVLEQTVSTVTSLTSKDISEAKSVTDKDISESQQITPTATIIPNQVVEIKLSNDGSTENPRRISITTKPITLMSSEIDIDSQNKPSTDEIPKLLPTVDMAPLTATEYSNNKESGIHFTSESENLPNAESLKLSSFVPSLAESNIQKAELPTTVDETLFGTPTQDINKNLNELSTTAALINSVSDKSISALGETNNNSTSSSEMGDLNRSKQINNENLYITSTRATTTIKTLLPTKKTSMLKKHNLKKATASSSSSSDTTGTISSSSSIEEGSVGHHDVYTSDEGSFEQHKPNRKRILTKPETQSYLKKILG
ncbi:mucin-2 [Condylostylus longicornis]|uniref:mucin-2 n=1 Tax=Condylostylus longicornis TaxID=2530218 RepID=UPI00244D9E16|nr:mucin-2 [Condylostylus longicornis]XP_055390621.1 mucin-2 [Condylostylus longicornis]